MPKKAPTAEISLSRYLDEGEYHIETNDKATAERLKRMGWKPTPHTARGPWWGFMLPERAILIRQKAVVDNFKEKS